jgi:hypothetical protein
LIVLGCLVGGLVLFVLGYLAGDYASFGRQYKKLQDSYFGYQRGEFLLVKENLEERDMSPQAREHLKDRLYVLAAALPPEYLRPESRNFDFGPIDKTMLRGLRASARSDIEGKSYELAKARHNPGPARTRAQVQSNNTVDTDARKSGARGSP